ncbi:DNA-binding response regulator [Alicyclobacillus hesperidum]|uniref:DNA-binding response regulator n=1 Tax=Alicyclobacillus hesperidum TaxID=89784 RepID=A0A1H2X611_9BACL|nr:response regulator [Alicyclobacillus hesperidum]GLV14759.1 DNA-binding response regulator [Alicyclobacillus hesperidum]SDW87709.1 two-component system, OmpR family, response regulator VicR [Alicyclobacillus hesperidum]
MQHILVVEDEEPIANILRFALERSGYRVTCAYDGREAVDLWRAHAPDLMLLDVMLPELDGFDVLRTVRQTSGIPVIMLTAKDDEVDKVLGLELGADDYVTKPFSTRELLARVKANLRRAGDVLNDGKESERYIVQDLVIDLQEYSVAKGGQPISLTHREFQVLALLAAHPGRVFTREQLVDQVWGIDYVGDTRAVDVTIRRLREKLEPDPSQPRYVMTRRGVGYYVRNE